MVLLAAVLSMSVAVPGYTQMTGAEKDECVLASRNCKTAVDDIQTQISRIAKEIEKGSAVYTPQEMKKLEQKLADVKDLLRDLEKR